MLGTNTSDPSLKVIAGSTTCAIGMYRINMSGSIMVQLNLCVPSGIQTWGLSISHRVNYEAAALTSQPPRPDTYQNVI